MFSRSSIALVLVLSAGSTSCWLGKPKRVRVFVPPATAPRPPIPAQAPTIAAEPPKIETASGGPDLVETGGVGPVKPTFPRLQAPPEPRRAPVATPRPAPAPPAPAEPPTQQPPRLGQIFTAEQIREYNSNLDESLERVRKVLGSLAGRRLSSEQAEVVNRIRTFQSQAEQAREQDLVTAVSLARRADLLAQDLIGRLP